MYRAMTRFCGGIREHRLRYDLEQALARCVGEVCQRSAEESGTGRKGDDEEFEGEQVVVGGVALEVYGDDNHVGG